MPGRGRRPTRPLTRHRPARADVHRARRRGRARGASLGRVQRKVSRRKIRNRALSQNRITPRPAVRPKSRPRRVMPGRPLPVARARPVRARSAGPNIAEVAAATAVAALAFRAAQAPAELAPASQALEQDLVELQERSTLQSVLTDIHELDLSLNHALDLLESARERGYHYQNDLEDLAHQAVQGWTEMRRDLEAAIQSEARGFQNRLQRLHNPIRELNGYLSDPQRAAPLLQSTHTQVNDLLHQVGVLEGGLESRYREVELWVDRLNRRLTEVHYALNQLDEAHFALDQGEHLVMAGAARWDQAGNDDPEGVLYLTNRRLVFERKEREATKKVLFLTMASELVQEVVISEPLAAISTPKAAARGLFGHQDFLEVIFESSQLGEVHFHLDGQDSQTWATLVAQTRTGKIEATRQDGRGLSYRAFTGPLTQAALLDLQQDVDGLHDEMMLQGVRQELEDLENEVRSLERRLPEVRARGYLLENHLETDVAVLVSQWVRVKANALKTSEHQARLLGEQMQSIQELLARLVGRSGDLEQARPQYLHLKSALASAEARAEAASNTVQVMYDDYREEVETLAAHLDWIVWMLDALASATFSLLASESGVAAVEAVWFAPVQKAENGVLFLTDQRLLWEDRVGEFTLKVEVPLAQVLDVRLSEGEEGGSLLNFTFEAGGPLPMASFQLAEPVGEAWLKMMGRARSGEYASDRAESLDPEELARVQAAPERCPNCGAAFTAPILRGQRALECEYCGVSTRL